MKGFRIAGVGVALLAVLAFSAMSLASSASAAIVFLLAFWLTGGNNVVATILVLAEGELLLVNLLAPIVDAPASVLCSGKLDGFVGPNSADDITELLTLGAVAVSPTALVGTSLSCTLDELCETGSKVWAVNLPWLTELELWEESATVFGFVDLILPHTGGNNPGWYVECKTALATISEECTTPEGVAEQVNVALSGVESIFSEAFTTLMGAKLALCSGNNEETGVVEGSGLTSNQEAGGILSASST
jgi:hypothetical protein